MSNETWREYFNGLRYGWPVPAIVKAFKAAGRFLASTGSDDIGYPDYGADMSATPWGPDQVI